MKTQILIAAAALLGELARAEHRLPNLSADASYQELLALNPEQDPEPLAMAYLHAYSNSY